MGVPTQVAGGSAESFAAAAAAGYFGWSPDADRTVYTVQNGRDGTAAVAYATTTAYAVGKTVTDAGITYVVRTAVTVGNTTAPAANASFVPVDQRRGGSEFVNGVTRRPQFYR